LSYIKFDDAFFVGVFRLSLADRGVGLFDICFHAATLKNRDSDSTGSLKTEAPLFGFFPRARNLQWR